MMDGWKAENGFKAGFQRELEKGMRKILPSTDIVVSPHINSKIHVWKKKYSALSDVMSKSGIGEIRDKYILRNLDAHNEVDDISIRKPSQSRMKSTSKGKKRKSVDADLSQSVDSLGEFMKHLKEVLSDSKNGKEMALNKTNKNKKLNKIMKGITGLKVSDKLKVCDELVQNKSRLDFS
ncbi:hypothetical protein ACS0TY_024549 [Phlomoides rotata]